MYASHLINCLPSAALNSKTPFEVWSGMLELWLTIGMVAILLEWWLYY